MLAPEVGMAAPDPARLDFLRRNSGLSVDREGRVRHEGDLLGHPRLTELFLAGLDVDDRGEAIVRIGSQWAYVRCDGTPFVAVRARVDDAAGRLHLTLNTGEALDLSAQDLTAELWDDSDLRVRIHGGRHWARLGRTAWAALAERLEADDTGVWLRVADRNLPVTRHSADLARN